MAHIRCIIMMSVRIQNRFLLIDAQSGAMTPRGAILNHIPVGRLCRPEDLVGTLIGYLQPPGSVIESGTLSRERDGLA